jgi:protein phosphatase
VLVVLLVLAGAVAAVGLYARGSYYVGLDDGEVVVFKGRPGGLLWFQPTVESRTKLLESDVRPSRVDDLSRGKVEPSAGAARRYVANLRREAAPPPTTVPPPVLPAP